MKRKLLILGCFILFSSYVFAGTFTPVRESINLKIGLSKGDATMDVVDDGEKHDPEATVDGSMSINVEYIISTASGMEYGAGIGAAEIDTGDSHDELGDTYDEVGDIYSFPVYALARYKFDSGREWVPYVFGNLGYAFVDERAVDNSSSGSDVTEIEGGLYTALGLGAEYQEKFSIELMWNKTSMDITRTGAPEFEGDLYVEMITLAFGYRMDL